MVTSILSRPCQSRWRISSTWPYSQAIGRGGLYKNQVLEAIPSGDERFTLVGIQHISCPLRSASGGKKAIERRPGGGVERDANIDDFEDTIGIKNDKLQTGVCARNATFDGKDRAY